MLEHTVHELLLQAHSDGALEVFGADPALSAADLELRKAAADQLVRLRLAQFEDDARTRLRLTNPGRYWALNGGYMALLKDDPERAAGGNGRGRNPEMEQLRYQFMTLRMRTFWWSFGISIASFVMSLASLSIALRYGGALLRP